jgi:hypothetical protein
MDTTNTNTTRAARFAAIVIVGALALSVAAIATIGAESSGTDSGFLTRVGDYIAAASEALGGG